MTTLWYFRVWLLNQPKQAEVGISWSPRYCPLAVWLSWLTGKPYEVWSDTYNPSDEEEDADLHYCPLWMLLYQRLVEGRKDHYFSLIRREQSLDALAIVERIEAQRLLPGGKAR